MQLSVSAYIGASAVIQLLAGPVSDRFGRRPVYLVGALGVGVWGFVFFALYNTQNFGLLVLAGAIGLIFGIVVLFNLGIGLVALIWLIGIWAIVFGLALIVLGLQVRKAAKAVTAG